MVQPLPQPFDRCVGPVCHDLHRAIRQITCVTANAEPFGGHPGAIAKEHALDLAGNSEAAAYLLQDNRPYGRAATLVGDRRLGRHRLRFRVLRAVESRSRVALGLLSR
jgi:hypothetical protein